MPELRRILLVEDDPDVQVVTTMALEAVGGFSVVACASGSEALARLPGMAPDLILLDVMMPGLDGPATLAALRQHEETAETPVVFLTARVQAHEVARYREMGAADVIAKPFDPMTLAETVRSVWESLRWEDAGDFASEEEELRSYFAGRLPQRLAELEAAVAAAGDAGWTGEPLRTAHRLAHSLAGAGETFGFPEVSGLARRLEHLLAATPAAGEPGEILAALRRAGS